MIVATKARFPMGNGPNDLGNSRKHLGHALDESLKRLGIERIDLYQMHGWDALTPIEETLRFLNDAITAGKIGYYGFSNFLGWHVAKACELAKARGWATSAQGQFQKLVTPRFQSDIRSRDAMSFNLKLQIFYMSLMTLIGGSEPGRNAYS